MKKILLLLITCSLLMACSHKEKYAIIDLPEKPFIVAEIEIANKKGGCFYLSKDQNPVSNASFRSKICAPCGIYNVGDTVKLQRR